MTSPKPLTEEQLNQIAGGDGCTIRDVQDALSQLKESYETLIEFASYVMERVGGP